MLAAKLSRRQTSLLFLEHPDNLRVGETALSNSSAPSGLGRLYIRSRELPGGRSKGIELFSHHYSCDALRRLWESGKRGQLRVKADPADIGAISIEIDGKWEAAEAVSATPLFGISLSEWTEKFREIKQRYAHEAELTESIRTRAIDEICAMDKASRIRAGVMPGEPSYEQIKAIQKNLFHGTSFRTGPAIIETPVEGFIGQRITLPPEDNPEASKPTDPKTEDDHQTPRDATDDSAWGFDDE